MNQIAKESTTPKGPSSVSGAPNLPAGFTDTFTSRFINAGGLRQHAVIGGEGPPQPQVETDFALRHHCSFWAAK